jgi:hypothetical protein
LSNWVPNSNMRVVKFLSWDPLYFLKEMEMSIIIVLKYLCTSLVIVVSIYFKKWRESLLEISIQTLWCHKSDMRFLIWHLTASKSCYNSLWKGFTYSTRNPWFVWFPIWLWSCYGIVKTELTNRNRKMRDIERVEVMQCN